MLGTTRVFLALQGALSISEWAQLWAEQPEKSCLFSPLVPKTIWELLGGEQGGPISLKITASTQP